MTKLSPILGIALVAAAGLGTAAHASTLPVNAEYVIN